MSSPAEHKSGVESTPLLDRLEDCESRLATVESRLSSLETKMEDTDEKRQPRMSRSKSLELKQMEQAEKDDRKKLHSLVGAPDVNLPVEDAVAKLLGDWYKGRPERREVFSASLPVDLENCPWTGGDSGLVHLRAWNSSGDLTTNGEYWSGSLISADGGKTTQVSMRLGSDTLLIVKQLVDSAWHPAWDKAEVAHKDKDKAYEIYLLRYRIQAWDTLPELDKELGFKVPFWAYSTSGVNVSLDCAVGPSIPLMRCVAGMNFLLQGGMMYLAWLETDVKKGDVFNPTYDPRIWIVPLPFVALKVACEFMILRLFMIPYVIKCRSANRKPFKVMGFSLPIYLWIMFACVSTVLLAVDLLSDGIFAGSSLKVLHDANSDALKDVWRDMWHMIPSWVEVHYLIWISVVTSLVQFVWPVVMTWRKEELSCRGPRLNEYNTEGGGKSLDGETSKNGSIALQLGEAANMAGVSMIALNQCSNRMATRAGVPSRSKDAVQNASEMGKITESRIFLALILENCLQLWIQHGIFIARRRLAIDSRGTATFESNTSEIQQLFSISTSAMSLVLKLVDVYAYLSAVRPVLRTCEQNLGELDDETKAQFYQARKRRRVVIILSVIVVSMSLSVAADIFAAYMCPCVRWNVLEVFNSNLGCGSCPVHS